MFNVHFNALCMYTSTCEYPYMFNVHFNALCMYVYEYM